MFQRATPRSPDLTRDERLEAIRAACNTDRSQMALIPADQLRMPEVEILCTLGRRSSLISRAGKRSSVPSSRPALELLEQYNRLIQGFSRSV